MPFTAILSLLGPLKHSESNIPPQSSFKISVACQASTLLLDAPTKYLPLRKGIPGVVPARPRIMPCRALPGYYHLLLDSDEGSPPKKVVGITSDKPKNEALEQFVPS